MNLFGANTKKSTFQKAKKRIDQFMTETSPARTDESSHIGEMIKDRRGPLPTDPDGTATTSEIAREELGDYLAESQPEPVTVPRELFNHRIPIPNAEVMARGDLSQIMEPVE